LKNVLWLTSWYPNRNDPFDGDFIQRHARAVAGLCRVDVLHLEKNDKAMAEYNVKGNLRERIIYYRPPRTGLSGLDALLAHRKYLNVYKGAIKEHFRVNGKPDLVHVQVALKAGLLALWIKKKWGIPFVLTEHWTGYLPEADDRIKDRSMLSKSWVRRIFQQATKLSVVSVHLGKAIQMRFPGVAFSVIPNVVDTDIFYPKASVKSGITRFIHVSNMNYQKNTEDILESLRLLKIEHPGFLADFYGNASPELNDRVVESRLQEQVCIHGEVPQPELALVMQQADALILYSRFETFGCVIIEANACGIPVIVSDIEVFHELVKEGVNGTFVAGEDPYKLCEKLKDFLNGRLQFDKDRMAGEAAAQYSFETVAKKTIDWYGF
jgi:glycosyltransferase involved in cell wall biosynthesis